MRSTHLALAVLLAVAGGCDRDGRIEAAADSGTDAGSLDASLDGGSETSDAEVDGGTPDPLSMAVAESRAGAADAQAAQAALDPSVTMGIEFLQLDLAQTRVDAIIGEKSTSLISVAGIIGEKSMTLAFGTPVAGTAVILRQLRQSEDDIAAVADLLDPVDPVLEPLRAALAAELESLATLRMQMLERYDELVTLAADLPGTEDLAYADIRSLHMMPTQSTVFAMLEGSTGAPGATVTVTCDLGSTAPLTSAVHDDRDETELAASAPSFGPRMFDVLAGRPTMLRVDLSGSIQHDRCDVEVRGRRHFRGPPTVLDSLQIEDLGTRRIDWDNRMSTLTGTLTMMRTEGDVTDGPLATIIEDYLREASSESGRWRGALSQIAPEDLDVLSLTLSHVVIPLSTELETYLATSSSRFAVGVQMLLAALRAHNEAALAILTPAP